VDRLIVCSGGHGVDPDAELAADLLNFYAPTSAGSLDSHDPKPISYDWQTGLLYPGPVDTVSCA
jgi:hypothetical protein